MMKIKDKETKKNKENKELKNLINLYITPPPQKPPSPPPHVGACWNSRRPNLDKILLKAGVDEDFVKTSAS